MKDLIEKLLSRKWEDRQHRQLREKAADVIAKQEARIAEMEALNDRLLLEAQCHAMEARGANATIHDAYQAVTEGKGEPGNWNGAVPIKDELARLRDRLTASEAVREKLREALTNALASGLPDIVAASARAALTTNEVHHDA